MKKGDRYATIAPFAWVAQLVEHFPEEERVAGSSPAPSTTPIMYYVYVLKSERDKNGYIGSTPDLRRRVAEHQRGKVTSTKPRLPLSLVYYEAYKSKVDALRREKSLKLKSRAYAQLRRRLIESLA